LIESPFFNVSVDEELPELEANTAADCGSCNAFDEIEAKINENDSTFISFCSDQNMLEDEHSFDV